MNDLIEWLRAQYDADERGIREALRTAEWGVTERDLIDIDSKRKILGVCEAAIANQGIYGEDAQEQVAEDILRIMAQPYADRPGFQQEWAA